LSLQLGKENQGTITVKRQMGISAYRHIGTSAHPHIRTRLPLREIRAGIVTSAHSHIRKSAHPHIAPLTHHKHIHAPL
jgi:hypothetical protein